jgi:hypothetical protein
VLLWDDADEVISARAAALAAALPAAAGPGICCSPLHGVPMNSTNKILKGVSVM